MVVWCFMVLLAAAGADFVQYPAAVCGVKGSTVTLPCNFSSVPSISVNGEKVPVERVVWCRDHTSCQDSAVVVYDSQSENNASRYRYLGDRSRSCTLQVTELQQEDQGTLRFSVQAKSENVRGGFTGQRGVTVTVSDGVQMDISSSAPAADLTEGETVTLLCSAVCSFHQLELTWSRDGHALSETGPALRLGPLTAEDSGNYTCGLKGKKLTESRPFRLQVEAAVNTEPPCGSADALLAVRLLLFCLHSVLVVTAAAVVIHRTCVCKKAAASRESEQLQQDVKKQEASVNKVSLPLCHRNISQEMNAG